MLRAIARYRPRPFCVLMKPRPPPTSLLRTLVEGADSSHRPRSVTAAIEVSNGAWVHAGGLGGVHVRGPRGAPKAIARGNPLKVISVAYRISRFTLHSERENRWQRLGLPDYRGILAGGSASLALGVQPAAATWRRGEWLQGGRESHQISRSARTMARTCSLHRVSVRSKNPSKRNSACSDRLSVPRKSCSGVSADLDRGCRRQVRCPANSCRRRRRL